jgi:pyruvate ferredoxin oxidoreductase alpha subunit
VLDGNNAIAEAARLSRVQVVSAYPITPQSAIAERLAEMVGNGELAARYLRVESEHSALSAAIGACLVGARAFSATSSVGLALMHEVLGTASGCRQPLVMGVVNRALLGPWNVWGDQSDAMGTRDQGWLSFFASTVQEALDLVIMGYRVAEDPRVLLPIMVNIDGFFLSHVTETLQVPDQQEVDDFLPARTASPVRLDVDDPMVVNPLTPPDQYTEVRHEHSLAVDAARKVIDQVMGKFGQQFERPYGQLDCFGHPDADLALVALGSVSGTIQQVLTAGRHTQRAKLIKLTTFRPFPSEALRAACRDTRAVGVIERSPALGYLGPLTSEVRAALYGSDAAPPVMGFVAGLGGRDIAPMTIGRMIESLGNMRDPSIRCEGSEWIDIRRADQ